MNCCELHKTDCQQGRTCPARERPEDDSIPMPLKVLCVIAAIFCIVVSSGALDCYFPKVNPQCSSST